MTESSRKHGVDNNVAATTTAPLSNEEANRTAKAAKNTSPLWNVAKCVMAMAFLGDAALRLTTTASTNSGRTSSSGSTNAFVEQQHNLDFESSAPNTNHRRLLEEVPENGGGGRSGSGNEDLVVPSYMEPLMEDLRQRQKLFDDAPPEEVKYWFEYTGPLQKYYYRGGRFSADYFEGRDDSGVVSSRFIRDFGGTQEHAQLFQPSSNDVHSNSENDPATEAARRRLLENCISMGHATNRPDTTNMPLWKKWYGDTDDRCRILFSINTVGAGGRGPPTLVVSPNKDISDPHIHTTLWDTTPPHPNDDSDLYQEQGSAATHIKRNLQELNVMCASGLVAVKVQVLVCEPIHPQWVEWMDSHLVACGGKPWPESGGTYNNPNANTAVLEDRPSPLQVVVAGPQDTAAQCHDAKSGFMEQRMQDLLFSQPAASDNGRGLTSNGQHDLHVGLTWSSLVTMRAVASFLQASADAQVATDDVDDAATDDIKQEQQQDTLIPSFVRVSYISQENVKEAKWRMHGDFFHPAAWEVCKDSYSVVWIPNSLATYNGTKGIIQPICPVSKEDAATSARKLGSGDSCGQWWISFTELQMPTSPEIYANEQVPSLVPGGSNSFWMLTERQRRQVAKIKACRKDKNDNAASCPMGPQGVIPLGDLQSFLINFTPNTGLGKKHARGRRPGYHKEKDGKAHHERDIMQSKGDAKVESALFDYTIYPAALFHKDATLKAARQRDAALAEKTNKGVEVDEADLGPALPTTVKSSYYDVTITKPRPPVLGWCQAMARRGLCSLFADYFRTSNDGRCMEACGLRWNFTPMEAESE